MMIDKQALKAEAVRLGFLLLGVTQPDPPPHAGNYQSWLDAGRHAMMAYLDTPRARQARANPLEILPECRSIVVLAFRYPDPRLLNSFPDRLQGGVVARQARQPGPFPELVEGRDESGPLARLSLTPFDTFGRGRNSLPELVEGSRIGASLSAPLDRLGERPLDTSLQSVGERGLSEPRGKVAAYAWGEDYHNLLPQKIDALVAYLEREAGGPFPYKRYTDTGPILERDLAQRAGLGWAGKNTCLISPQHGSYFFLAELFLPFEIELDPPFTSDQCGSCRRCIDACPTGCILPDRTIDAGRCISYLTIENKGTIPVDLRPQLGEWVFGCDICQMVCPWNLRFSDVQLGLEFEPQESVAAPILADELALTPQEFNHKFKNSPVQRARRRGYLRNVAVAIGNAANSATIPALTRALQKEPEPLVRAHVAWALGRISGEIAQSALQEALPREPDEIVRGEIQAAIGLR